jgi:hypothetical protein
MATAVFNAFMKHSMDADDGEKLLILVSCKR